MDFKLSQVKQGCYVDIKKDYGYKNFQGEHCLVTARFGTTILVVNKKREFSRINKKDIETLYEVEFK